MTPQWSLCTADTGRVHEGGVFHGLPVPCGARAAGPHPDPAKSYREPLCAHHRELAVAALEGEPAAGIRGLTPSSVIIDDPVTKPDLTKTDPTRPALLGIPFDPEADEAFWPQRWSEHELEAMRGDFERDRSLFGGDFPPPEGCSFDDDEGDRCVREAHRDGGHKYA